MKASALTSILMKSDFHMQRVVLYQCCPVISIHLTDSGIGQTMMRWTSVLSHVFGAKNEGPMI
jgi:hypothetical protein